VNVGALFLLRGQKEATMKSIKVGDRVQITCEAKLESGELCYKNDADNLIELIVGEEKFFPMIEKALEEMSEGQTKTITLEAAQAFGPHIPELVIKVPRHVFQNDCEIELGSRVKIAAPTGKSFIATVIEMDDSTLTLDMNHLLAGKRLIVTFTVVSILAPIASQ
jgi:peptidylprolyl isomerase